MAGYEDYISAMAQQSQENNVFNARQAQINRDFQLEMSNTAHQREVKDLIAAGLNPILSVNAGASTGSGSMATADTSSASGYAQLANTGMNNITQLAMAQIAANAQMQAAQISAQAVRDAAERSALASEFGSRLSYQKTPIGAIDSILGNALGSSTGSAIQALKGLEVHYDGTTSDANRRIQGLMSSGNSLVKQLYKKVQAKF